MSWLTVKIGRFIHSALSEAQKSKNDESFNNLVSAPAEVKGRNDPLGFDAPQTQFTVVKVSNGRLVKVSEYKPTKSHHSDWTHEVYIVKDDEKVPDVIARIMAIKALEQ